jgi:hypothetical protein
MPFVLSFRTLDAAFGCHHAHELAKFTSNAVNERPRVCFGLRISISAAFFRTRRGTRLLLQGGTDVGNLKLRSDSPMCGK